MSLESIFCASRISTFNSPIVAEAIVPKSPLTLTVGVTVEVPVTLIPVPEDTLVTVPALPVKPLIRVVT